MFAGIGGFRNALARIETDWNVPFRNIGFSEIDKYASISYKANYNTSNELEIGDIVEFNSNFENIIRLESIDLLSGGFPCQSFSMMGKQLGFADARGNMFFEIMKIVEQKHPRFILLENVRNLLSHDDGNTFSTIEYYLNEAGYHVYKDIFNTVDYHLAQKRKRIYIFATYLDLDENFKFSAPVIHEVFEEVISASSLLKQTTIHDVLEDDVEEKYYLSDRIKRTILANGSKSYKSRSIVNPVIAKPLTATMAKMHRACQDNYFTDDFVKGNSARAEMPTSEMGDYTKEAIRKLTPKEALALQGFDSGFYENAVKAGVSNSQLYKEAGNAVSVNVVYAIAYYLFVHLKLQDL